MGPGLADCTHTHSSSLKIPRLQDSVVHQKALEMRLVAARVPGPSEHFPAGWGSRQAVPLVRTVRAPQRAGQE